jgi:lambda family phage portal protein
VLLNLIVIETEQVDNYVPQLSNPMEVEGIRFDAVGNPTEYAILKHHPGSGFFGSQSFEAEWYPASRVLHWFKPRRPGQARGVSELAPSLELFAQLRRYSKAVLTAAETAAMLAGVMESTDMPIADPTQQEYGPVAFDKVKLVAGTLMQLPPNTKASQFKPEQPTSSYGEFKRENLGDAGRPLGATLNVTTGNSSGYNYSSGRLDHAIYHKGQIVDRERLRNRVLDPLVVQWLSEALLIENFLPTGLPPLVEWQWEWYWDGYTSIDPVKEATATQTMLSIGMTTLAEEYAAFGQDWEEQITQRVKEIGLIQRLCAAEGIDPASVSELLAPKPAAVPQTENEVANAA